MLPTSRGLDEEGHCKNFVQDDTKGLDDQASKDVQRTPLTDEELELVYSGHLLDGFELDKVRKQVANTDSGGSLLSLLFSLSRSLALSLSRVLSPSFALM